MSKIRGKKVRRRKSVTSSPVSLPPPGLEKDTGSLPTSPDAISVPKPPESRGSDEPANKPAKKAFWDVGKDSVVYERAMQILALRATGIDDKEIADTLKLSMQTVWNYCYIAGKNGWAETFGNAKDQIEFGIMPKVVREIEAGLDDNTRHVTSGMKVRTAVALKVAEGTIFKRFEQTTGAAPISNVIAIRIENVGAPIVETVRTYSGTPAYQEGEVTDVGERGDAE